MKRDESDGTFWFRRDVWVVRVLKSALGFRGFYNVQVADGKQKLLPIKNVTY
jgi:hypothetical protein